MQPALRAMADLIDEWLDATAFGVSSTHPSSERFESQRYWRGPVWLHINWMIAEGLRDYSYDVLEKRVKEATQKCVDASGFYEYFDAISGAGCGGGRFSWTAEERSGFSRSPWASTGTQS